MDSAKGTINTLGKPGCNVSKAAIHTYTDYRTDCCTDSHWDLDLFSSSNHISPLLNRPQGCQGCQKITFFILQMKLFSFCAKIAPKRHKLQKPSKLKKKCQKKPCFLRLFQTSFNLGAILAHQISTGIFNRSWRIFWHPWDRWGICFDYFVTVVPPGGFFTFMKMLPNVSFIIKVI